MPVTVENGGALTMHSHAAGFIMPEIGSKFGSPSGCQNGSCHLGADALALQAAFDRTYRRPNQIFRSP
jgi:hypothetical protein